MQSLTPQKAQLLVKSQRRNVGNFGLENNFVRASVSHSIHGHANESSCNALATVFFGDGEHGDVAAKCAAAVVFKLTDYDAAEGFSLRVESLDARSTQVSSSLCAYVQRYMLLGQRTM